MVARQLIVLASKMKTFTFIFSAYESSFPVLHIFCLVVGCLIDSCSDHHFAERNSGKISWEVCYRKQRRTATVAWWRHQHVWVCQHCATDHCTCSCTSKAVPFCSFCPALGRANREWNRAMTRYLVYKAVLSCTFGTGSNEHICNHSNMALLLEGSTLL